MRLIPLTTGLHVIELQPTDSECALGRDFHGMETPRSGIEDCGISRKQVVLRCWNTQAGQQQLEVRITGQARTRIVRGDTRLKPEVNETLALFPGDVLLFLTAHQIGEQGS
eukprot:CAMPEP_0174722378 /NCGR_PEP_ID=MMETSP1094-20130205/38312_1 /TAXON_ID=156173 /ORGANISM="Chrysochromulina brevifilum, Strain UTEX LB 985" /LENGTH=110 /DNA_ID=CAMNT_0015923227 /DNA_START=100 /DNA_END=428 /DNA_ORIENTATION=+